MSGMNISPISLLGREVSFRDLAFERSLLKLNIPSDFPPELLSSVRSGVVTSVVLSLSGEPEISVSDGDFYCLSDCHFLMTSKSQ